MALIMYKDIRLNAYSTFRAKIVLAKMHTSVKYGNFFSPSPPTWKVELSVSYVLHLRGFSLCLKLL